MELKTMISEVTFWVVFLFFNTTVFALDIILNYHHSVWIPFKDLGKRTRRGVFIYIGPSLYRICFELVIVVFVVRITKIQSGHIIFSLYYSFLLLYNIYHYSFSKIYQLTPILSNDLKLIKNGIAILWAESPTKLVSYSLLFLSIFLALTIGFSEFLYHSSLIATNTFFWGVSSLLAVYILASFIYKGLYQSKFDLYHRVLFMLFRISSNLYQSWILIKKKREFRVNKKRNTNLKLKIKPNVFFLFVESYGSILIKDEKIRNQYTSLANSKFSNLSQKGWISTSNMSEGPSLIGPSWIAYTSVLNGVKIANNFEYEYLLNHTETHSIQSLAKLFQQQGYTSYYLNASVPKKGIHVPYKQMGNLYGIDKWVLEKDINYQGISYGAIENPPDQYTLNFTLDEIIKKNHEPHFLFYLTKNSHSPYISPKSIEEDWRELNNDKKKLVGDNFLQKPNLPDYLNAITYQLDMLSDLILTKGGDNDIFVLYGDHQPPYISTLKEHGKETLVHVISKNEKFINSFSKYGFKTSLEKLSLPIKHESFYSAFSREIIRNYGEEGILLPDYEPDGLPL